MCGFHSTVRRYGGSNSRWVAKLCAFDNVSFPYSCGRHCRELCTRSFYNGVSRRHFNEYICTLSAYELDGERMYALRTVVWWWQYNFTNHGAGTRKRTGRVYNILLYSPRYDHEIRVPVVLSTTAWELSAILYTYRTIIILISYYTVRQNIIRPSPLTSPLKYSPFDFRFGNIDWIARHRRAYNSAVLVYWWYTSIFTCR